MSDDTDLKMYKFQAELVETEKNSERIQKEKDELKNQMAVNNLVKSADDFERKYSNTFEITQENLSSLTRTVSNNHEILAEIKETLKDLKETIQIQKENEKSLVGDHASLSENVEAIQVNVTTLSKQVSGSDQILSGINETLRKQNDALEKKDNDIQVMKKDMKTKEKETILLLGGWNGSETVDSLLILQNNGKKYESWKELRIKLPHAIRLHGAQFLNNTLYIFGGQNENNEALNSAYKLTRTHKGLTISLQWEKIKDMNEKRTSIPNSSVILNNRIWVMNGWNETETLKSVEVYNPRRNIWKNMKPMNERRSLAAAAVVNKKIFCCGGWNGKTRLSSVERYDPSTDIWTLISDMPGPNGACGVVEIDAHLIVIGGASSSEDIFSSLWVLNTADKKAKWIEKESHMSLARCQYSIAKIGGKIFVCGGLYIDKKDSELRSTSDVEVFDGEVWRNGPKLTTCRKNASAVIIPTEFARELDRFVPKSSGCPVQ